MFDYINEQYFNNNLPHYEPQLMVLFWSWENQTPGLYFKKKLEENFSVEKLKAMLKN